MRRAIGLLARPERAQRAFWRRPVRRTGPAPHCRAPGLHRIAAHLQGQALGHTAAAASASAVVASVGDSTQFRSDAR
jgi:hypothetical protein